MLLNSNTYSLKYAPGENKQPLGLLIDLNAENAENDTLVDASALNETADINTEINEPIIQMVVPASIVGLAIRGVRGGRGRGAGVESITESETSTLRRSKRNCQNSS